MSRIDQAFARAAAISPEGSSEAHLARTSDVSNPWGVEPAKDLTASDATTGTLVASLPAASGTVAVEQTMFVSRLNPEVFEKVVVTPLVDPRSVEQYRRSAALLHLRQAERGIKIVMVASAEQGEGKTLTATNLALTLSESYRRSVLLVDADLRRPAIHRIFQIPNVTGLTDGLKSIAERKIAVVQYSEFLSILPAGKPDPDPMSALTSDRMHRVLSEAAATFHWVVLDTPPIGLLPDAHLLASLADAVLLVVRAGKTPHASVKRAISAIGSDRIFGVVLNRVPHSTRQRDYQYLQSDIPSPLLRSADQS